MSKYIFNAAIIAAKCSGSLSGFYLIVLGLMLILGGPDGNATAEAKMIGGGYAVYGLVCVCCVFLKARFISANVPHFMFFYFILILPLLYLIHKDNNAIVRFPSPFVAYLSVLAIFMLIQIRSSLISNSAR